MKDLILSLIGGIVVGILFKSLRLPMPAPPILSGVLGVFGIYFGGVLTEWISQLFKIH